MENPQPSCSKPEVQEEISELIEIQGIKVWGEYQEVLEKQALEELVIFSQENNSKEDGELSESESTNEVLNEETVTNKKPQLDVDTYIKRQVELKRIQELKRTSCISEKSRTIAEQIASKHKDTVKKTKKRTLSKSSNEAAKGKKARVCVEEENVDFGGKCKNKDSDDEYSPSDIDSEDSDYEPQGDHVAKKLTPKPKKLKHKNLLLGKVVDDGSLEAYKSRLENYYEQLEKERELLNMNNDDEETLDEDVEIEGGIKLPQKLWFKLYKYQQKGVKWMLQLHKKLVGGLLGDEMGLGKTVQIIVFLHILNHNALRIKQGGFVGLGPTLIVCPATVIQQWVKHFHEWVPEFRVAVLHQSGSYNGNKFNLIKDINKDKGILMTTYSGFLKYHGYLIEQHWHYLILDEGHKIRNPNAQITVAVKKINTPHRLLLTGSPMQNNLQELWSLFDFIYPSLLGTLQIFTEHFVNPIIQGGFANSTYMQEATALSVATTLKNIISPYMLRRTKAEVQEHICLPNKKEQVLFCKLTSEQIDLYKGYLMTDHVNAIIGRGSRTWNSENQMKANVLMAITTLRKICNHPDLYAGAFEDQNCNEEEKYGYYKRSGKMVVVSALLKLWKKQNHRVLLFTQARAMILIFEDFLRQQNYTFLKMDGSTNISARQGLIDKFNQDSTIDVFLLTTRVGGLGINLTGANRVIIYDPDWNPATDTQARERAWRIGQEKDVTIYRLISAGTIEEKMYQRQIWKQLLSNKVLVDPGTQKFFKNSGLHDLFSLDESPDERSNETANIFKNSRIEMQKKLDEKRAKKAEKAKKKKEQKHTVVFSQDKIQQMRDLAQKISKNLTQNSEAERPSKSVIQLEMEVEKVEKKGEREYLKTLTPTQLREYNRKKCLENGDDESINEIDGYKTDIPFAQALDLSEKTAELHVDLQNKRDVYNNLNKLNSEKMGSYKSCENGVQTKLVIDISGKIDGETINGLVKSEMKKTKVKKRKDNHVETQDEYVLNKLFSKKGIQTALEHDSIIDGKKEGGNSRFRIENEAQAKAELALEAIRKSRLNKWTW